LAAESTMIVHCAASVSFGLSLDEARAINVAGTRRMLKLAGRARELGVLARYAQVSTTYVAGTHAGRFYEYDLDVGQSFHNPYEQSKFEAERLIHSHPDLPFTILLDRLRRRRHPSAVRLHRRDPADLLPHRRHGGEHDRGDRPPREPLLPATSAAAAVGG
jgi:nucleoside-diphosphate-sugar epimerase